MWFVSDGSIKGNYQKTKWAQMKLKGKPELRIYLQDKDKEVAILELSGDENKMLVGLQKYPGETWLHDDHFRSDNTMNYVVESNNCLPASIENIVSHKVK